MAGSLDTEDIRVEERGKERVFAFRDYTFKELPVHLVCAGSDAATLQASASQIGAIIPVTSDRIDSLCAYCEHARISA